jgi:hypothetical protein
MIRKLIHWLIVAYLRHCWGAFHASAYGQDGRYVVLMNDQQYHYYTNFAQGLTPEAFHKVVWALREADGHR